MTAQTKRGFAARLFRPRPVGRKVAALLALVLLATCGGPSPAQDGGSGNDATAPDAAVSDFDAGPIPDCLGADVLCVDDDPGPTQEYATIAGALAAAAPGTVVLVHPGSYAGFVVGQSGSPGVPLMIRALPGAVIDRDGPTGDGVRLENVSHVAILGLRIVGPTVRCIAARGATPDVPMIDLAIVGNLCEGAGHEGFYLSEVSRSRIEGNHIERSGADGTPRGHGMYLANAGSDDTVIRSNTIAMTSPAESNGIHMNGDLSVGGDGMISGLLVEGNFIYGHAQNGLNLDGVEASTFRNNVVYANARHCLRGYRIDGAAGPRALYIVNNTFAAVGSGFAVRLTEDRGQHVIFNNVLYAESGGGSLSLEAPGLAVVGANATTDGTGVIAAATSLFVDFAAGNFRLAPGSQAIDRGLATLGGVGAPATDVAGATRPMGAAIDLGAYESP